MNVFEGEPPSLPDHQTEDIISDLLSQLAIENKVDLLIKQHHQLPLDSQSFIFRKLIGSPRPDDWVAPETIEEVVDQIVRELKENPRNPHPTKYEHMLEIIKATKNQGFTTGHFTHIFNQSSDPHRRATVMIGQLNVRHLNPHKLHIRRTPNTPVYHIVTRE